jgi:hypothetical protein
MGKSQVSLAHHLSQFEAVFCSGFFIPDPAIITALALLFERVYFTNSLEYVVEFARKYRFTSPEPLDVPELTLTPADLPDDISSNEINEDDPLSSLNPDQKRTAHAYLYFADQFFVEYSSLFPEVFYCNHLPNGEVFSVELIKEKVDGDLNEYKVTKNPLIVSMGGTKELQKLEAEGKIPVIGSAVPLKKRKSPHSPEKIAAMLALNSVAMVLPATKEADDETILEAREKLKDHLPPFWSSMLKLSAELKGHMTGKVTEEELNRECQHAVATLVRPSLIDLVDKLEKERKQWFYRILSPIATGLRVLAGKPPLDAAGLISASVQLSAGVTLDVAEQIRKVKAMESETGLAYLLELHKEFSRK